MMKYDALSKSILQLCAGEANISWAGHCATRLRINVKDTHKVQLEDLESLEGVIGAVINGNQVQIIVGQDVPNLYRAFSKLINLEEASKGEAQKKAIGIRIIDAIAGVFTPTLPALCGAGMLKAVLVILTTFSLVEQDSTTYQLFNMFSDSLFYFLPVILAFTSAKKFNCNPYVAVTVAGILLHPTFTAMVAAGQPVDFFGVNVPLITYSSSVIPIILTVWVMGYIEQFFDRISPNFLKYFSVPLGTLLISAPIALFIFGPLGNILGGWLSQFILFMNTKALWLVITVMGAISPLIIMTGMHYSVFPVVFQSLAQYGYDTFFAVSCLPSNLAQGGACMAVALRTKNKELRSVAISSGVTAMMGITEPALYGVTLRLKRPLIAVSIAGGLGGLYAALVSLKSFGMVSPGLAAFAVFIDPSGSVMNLVNFGIVSLIGFVVGFALTLMLGFEDVPETKKKQASVEVKKEKLIQSIELYAPAAGQAIPLTQVNDQVFNSGIMGKGIAIMTNQEVIVSPVKGEITALFPSKHAIGITSTEGCAILLHMGLNTSQLNGEYFENHVQLHQQVEIGDKLATIDMKSCKELGYDMSICVVVTNSNDYFDVIETQAATVKVRDKIMEVV